MGGRAQAMLAVVATFQAIAAVLLAFGVQPLVDLIPIEGRTALSNQLIASILLAAAAATAWCLVEGSPRGHVGIALDYLAIFVPLVVLTLASMPGVAPERVAPTVALALCGVAGTVYGLWLLRWAWRHPWRDPRPTPRPVIGAFAVFVLALLLVGGALVAQVPRILPWQVTPELSTLFGLMFLGAATYFVYGLLDRRWENAGGQLAGFIAYDVVLILPFVLRLPTIEAELLLNLVVYLVVVVGSGILAAWYLVGNPATRVRLRARETATAAGAAAAEGPP
jgi:hypothetical protein